MARARRFTGKSLRLAGWISHWQPPHKRIVRSRPQMGHSLRSARACSLAKINSRPHETRGSYSQGSRVGTKIMITTSCQTCLLLRSCGSPIRAGPPEDPLWTDSSGGRCGSRRKAAAQCQLVSTSINQYWYTWFQVWFHNILHIHVSIYEFRGNEMHHMHSWIMIMKSYMNAYMHFNMNSWTWRILWNHMSEFIHRNSFLNSCRWIHDNEIVYEFIKIES